jgi:hypothetical protein
LGIKSKRKKTPMTNSIQGTAKIYQFPVRPRGLTGGREPQTPAPRATGPQVKVMESGGWYHDAAIEEARAPFRH